MRLLTASFLAAPVLLATAVPATAVAQPAATTAPAASQRMQPFAWLVGEWRGSGWTLTRTGRETFTSSESVTLRLSGNALLVEGRHYSSRDPSQIVHDAIALITWDERAQAYRFRTALATGMGADFPIVPTANGVTWAIDTPGGRIDYVITHENGTWTERGTRAGPNGQPVQFFEMILRRQ